MIGGRAAELVDIVAIAATQAIRAVAADEGVVAGAGVEQIVARFAAKDVVAVTAEQGIVAGATGQHVVSGQADQGIAAGAAAQTIVQRGAGKQNAFLSARETGGEAEHARVIAAVAGVITGLVFAVGIGRPVVIARSPRAANVIAVILVVEALGLEVEAELIVLGAAEPSSRPDAIAAGPVAGGTIRQSVTGVTGVRGRDRRGGGRAVRRGRDDDGAVRRVGDLAVAGHGIPSQRGHGKRLPFTDVLAFGALDFAMVTPLAGIAIGLISDPGRHERPPPHCRTHRRSGPSAAPICRACTVEVQPLYFGCKSLI